MGAEVGRGTSEVKTENSTFSLTLFLPLLPGAFYSQVRGSFCRVLVCIEKIESKQPLCTLLMRVHYFGGTMLVNSNAGVNLILHVHKFIVTKPYSSLVTMASVSTMVDC